MNLTYIYGAQGRREDAREEARHLFSRLDPDRRVSDDLLDLTAEIAAGRASVETAVHLIREYESYGMGSTVAAEVFTHAGQTDSAFARIDAAIAKRNEWLPIMMGLFYKYLGDDPRWGSVLDRMGL